MLEKMPELMTTAEIAELYRTSKETVRYWRNIGKGPRSFKIGREVLYARDDVAAHIAEARANGHDGDAVIGYRWTDPATGKEHILRPDDVAIVIAEG